MSKDLDVNSDVLLDGQLLPVEVLEQQSKEKTNQDQGEEQKHLAEVCLFFSFDIVNSTKYKTLTGNWPIVIRGLLEEIRSRVFRMPALEDCFLWRVIGDEMIFVSPIQNINQISKIIDNIFEVIQQITLSLKNGKFYDSLEGQILRSNDIAILKSQDMLAIKSTAWIAAVNDRIESPYDNISFVYDATTNNQIIKEFIGKDIDAGFRLKEYTQDRRLAVSFEIAYFLKLSNESKNLHVMDYVRLKGVWNDQLYPVLWYYNRKIVERYTKSENMPFERSFRYDETDNNPLVKKYFDRGKAMSKKRKKDERSFSEMPETDLARGMYVADSALAKIAEDKNLYPKIQYIESLCKEKIPDVHQKPYVAPLELHCVAVCYDAQEKKILVAKRGNEHSTNRGKWECGCAKATSTKTLAENIVEYYKDAFGIEIELCTDKERRDKQPIPLAVYEIQSENGIRKGIIFAAKVIRKISEKEFRPENAHDKIRWITKGQLNRFKEDEVVPDFHQTLTTVFDRADELFS